MGDGPNGDGPGDRPAAQRRSIDDLDPQCRRMLEEAGFTYDWRIGAWFNLAAGRVIAFDHIAGRTPGWLGEWLARF